MTRPEILGIALRRYFPRETKEEIDRMVTFIDAALSASPDNRLLDEKGTDLGRVLDTRFDYTDTFGVSAYTVWTRP